MFARDCRTLRVADVGRRACESERNACVLLIWSVRMRDCAGRCGRGRRRVSLAAVLQGAAAGWRGGTVRRCRGPRTGSCCARKSAYASHSSKKCLSSSTAPATHMHCAAQCSTAQFRTVHWRS
jgi:hypothetical protein